MKRIGSKTRPNGNRVVTVELEPDEDLISIRADGFYRLGGSDGDIVPGHLFHMLQSVYWSVEDQAWKV